MLDEANEKKYDRLVKEEKIKSPFKRRLSGENDATSTSEMDSKKTRLDEPKNLRDRLRTESSSSGGSSNTLRQNREFETDNAVLERRQKQVDYGKNTVGYENYLSEIPK